MEKASTKLFDTIAQIARWSVVGILLIIVATPAVISIVAPV